MQTHPTTTAHSLYLLYETLSAETQEQFLLEVFQHQTDKLESLALYLACKEAKEEDDFLTEEEAQAFIKTLPQ
jgi:hypothetical protein